MEQNQKNKLKKITKSLKMRKVSIDYKKVEEVANMNLTERKSVKMLNDMGVKISQTSYHKFKVSMPSKQINQCAAEPKRNMDAEIGLQRVNNEEMDAYKKVIELLDCTRCSTPDGFRKSLTILRRSLVYEKCLITAIQKSFNFYKIFNGDVDWYGSYDNGFVRKEMDKPYNTIEFVSIFWEGIRGLTEAKKTKALNEEQINLLKIKLKDYKHLLCSHSQGKKILEDLHNDRYSDCSLSVLNRTIIKVIEDDEEL